MKDGVKRLVTGLILGLVLIAIFILKNPIVDTAIVFILSVMGMYEYNKCFKAKGYHPIEFIGYLSCLILPLIGNVSSLVLAKTILATIPVLLVMMFGYIILKKLEITVIDVAITALSVVYVPFLFSFIKLLFILPHGRVYGFLAFVISISTDTFAYEIGHRWGKHKLSPTVSPKKSIEGSVAGIVGSMVMALITILVSNTYLGTEINIILMTALTAILSVVGQIGDLAASSIKRYCGVKDFSNLLPGHGGILDRLDSIMFIAPILYVCIMLVSLI